MLDTGLTQSSVQWVSVAVSLGLKRKRREANNSSLSIAEGKIGEAISPLPYTS
jgi:hypothetical protein